MWASVKARLFLYSNIIANMTSWATKQAVSKLLCRGRDRHPLNWPADQVLTASILWASRGTAEEHQIIKRRCA